MLDPLGCVIESLKSCVAFDAAELDGEAATEVWRRGGWRSVADWSARHSGVDPGRAREELEPPDPEIGATAFFNPWTGRADDVTAAGADQLPLIGAAGPAP